MHTLQRIYTHTSLMSFLCSPFCRHFFFPVFSILSTFFAFSFFAHHRRQHTVNAAALIYLVFLSCISSLVSLYEIIVFAVLKIPFEFQYTLEDSWLAVFCALFNGTFFRYAENNFILFCSHFHDLFFRKMKLKEKHITRFWVWASKDMLWINIHQLLRKYIASCSNLNGDTSLDLHCGLKIRFNTCLTFDQVSLCRNSNIPFECFVTGRFYRSLEPRFPIVNYRLWFLWVFSFRRAF